MAPSDPSGTVLEDCLRVRQSGAIRVLVALVRMIQDLWARASTMWLLGELSGIQGPDAHASKNGRGRLGSRQACLVRSVKPQTGASRSSGVEKGAHDGEGETCTHQFAQIFACFEIPRGGTF